MAAGGPTAGAILPVAGLPDAPLAAAAHFYAEVAPQVAVALAATPGGGGPVTLLLPPAGHDHRDWRRAAIAMLARAHAPARINALEGPLDAADPAVAACVGYLYDAPGVTGQVLALDGHGAGPVLG